MSADDLGIGIILLIFIIMDLQLIDQSYHISLCREITQNSQEDAEHNGVLFGGPALPNRSAENTTRRLSLGPSVVAALATLSISNQPSW
jgi:hypothetical protein